MGVLKVKIFKGTASTIWGNHCSKDFSGLLFPEPPCDLVYSPSTLWPSRPRMSELFFPITYPVPLGGLCQGPNPQQIYCESSLPFWSLRTPLAGYVGDMPSKSSIQQLDKVLWPSWTWNSLNRKVVAWYRSHCSEREGLRHLRRPPLSGHKNQDSTGSGKECLSPEISSSKPVHSANQCMSLGLVKGWILPSFKPCVLWLFVIAAIGN